MRIIKKIINSIKRNGLKRFIIIQFNKFTNLVKLLKRKKNPVEDSFELHSKLVNKIYEEGLDIAAGQISDELINALVIEFCNDSCFNDSSEIINSKSTHPILKIDNHSREIREGLNENIIAGNLHTHSSKNPTLKALHNELRRMLEIHVGSPFIFVNTRIWKSKPNTKSFGPNDWHTDGFSPGHRKIMIYITPLNDDYGSFEWKDSEDNIHRLNNEKPGKVFFFLNSDIPHQGVAGKTHDRIAIEVTLMRSLINGEQEWEGHFFGRHFKNLKKLENLIK